MKALLLLAVIFSSLLACQTIDQCSRPASLAAEVIAPAAGSWSDLYSSYQSYSQCDDGAIGQGFSDSVVRLLATQWESLPKLRDLAASDPKFGAFVLSHVDATADPDQLLAVGQFAANDCPVGLETLCKEITAAIPAR